MKKTLCLLVASFALFSCQKVADKNQMMYEEAALNKTKFNNVTFTNSVDFMCQMPLSYGVSDSAHYNGGVYGFCSKFCKEDFMRNPEKFLSHPKTDVIMTPENK